MKSNKFILMLFVLFVAFMSYFLSGAYKNSEPHKEAEPETIPTVAVEHIVDEQAEKVEKEHVEIIINENAYQANENVETQEKDIELVMYFDENDVIAMAKVLYNECRGIPGNVEKACVAWVACNRVDAEYGETIYEVLTSPHQFAYRENTPVTKELYNLAEDVLIRWNKEKNGIENVGRVLPQDYLFFAGDGEHNYFRNKFSGDFDVWDYSFYEYSLRNPYSE